MTASLVRELTNIWIPKDEPPIKLVLNPVHLASNDAK